MDLKKLLIQIWEDLQPWLTMTVHTSIKYDLELPIWAWIMVLVFIVFGLWQIVVATKRRR